MLDLFAPVLAAAVAQPEDRGAGVGRMVVGVVDLRRRPLRVGEEAGGRPLVADGALIELLGDAGVGRDLALLDRLLEVGELLHPVVDGGAADAEQPGQFLVGGAQHAGAARLVAAVGGVAGLGAACAHGADPLAGEVRRGRGHNFALGSQAPRAPTRENARGLRICGRGGPARASIGATPRSSRCDWGRDCAGRARSDAGSRRAC